MQTRDPAENIFFIQAEIGGHVVKDTLTKTTGRRMVQKQVKNKSTKGQAGIVVEINKPNVKNQKTRNANKTDKKGQASQGQTRKSNQRVTF